MELSNSKIDFKLLEKVFNGLAHFYIDTVSFYSSDNIKGVLNNRYYINNRFYREKVFKLTDSYFDNDFAKEIFNEIIRYCFLKKLSDPGISINQYIEEWKAEHLNSYIEKSKKQVLEDMDNRFSIRVKKYFNSLFKREN